MSDDVRLSPTASDKASPRLMPLDAVSARFIAAGLPRSMRSLQRYCNNGTLECVKEATDKGDAFFVHEHSVETAIASLRQLHDAKAWIRHDATQHDVARHGDPESAAHALPEDARHSPSEPDTVAENDGQGPGATEPDTTRYVAQLEARLDEKDEEIDFLREELIDRRGQIRDMKGIIDGQNQLLETIQKNIGPIFNALATSVKSQGLGLGREPGRPATNDRNTIESGGRQTFGGVDGEQS